MKKIIVFIKGLPIYTLLNWCCCIFSVILNIAASITNNNILRIIAWILIIIQYLCIAVQLRVNKYNKDIISGEDIFNIDSDIISLDKYKPEYKNKLKLFDRIKSKFKK